MADFSLSGQLNWVKNEPDNQTALVYFMDVIGDITITVVM